MMEAIFVPSTICTSKDSEEQLEEQNEIRPPELRFTEVGENPSENLYLVETNESICRYFVFHKYLLVELECSILVTVYEVEAYRNALASFITIYNLLIKLLLSADHQRCLVNICARFIHSDDCWGFASTTEWL